MKDMQMSVTKFKKSQIKNSDKKKGSLELKKNSHKVEGAKFLPYFENHPGADLFHRYQS